MAILFAEKSRECAGSAPMSAETYDPSKDESGFPTLEILKLGVFLHDIGKPAAKTVDATGRTHFKGHDVTGGEIVLRTTRINV